MSQTLPRFHPVATPAALAPLLTPKSECPSFCFSSSTQKALNSRSLPARGDTKFAEAQKADERRKERCTAVTSVLDECPNSAFTRKIDIGCEPSQRTAALHEHPLHLGEMDMSAAAVKDHVATRNHQAEQ